MKTTDQQINADSTTAADVRSAWEPPTLTEVEFHETAASASYTIQSDGNLYSGIVAPG